MENRTRMKMDQRNRAKQFMPFDALKGFREALEKKERIFVPKRDLSEEKNAELDWKLRQIHKKDILTVEYYQNGQYIKSTGMVSGIDENNKVIELENIKIPLEDISDFQGDFFRYRIENEPLQNGGQDLKRKKNRIR